jgi:hypothetical protein
MNKMEISDRACLVDESYLAQVAPQFPVQCGLHSIFQYDPTVLFHTLPGNEHGSEGAEPFTKLTLRGPLLH